jgi:diguanylate cyclase (GGDEF)-like protein
MARESQLKRLPAFVLWAGAIIAWYWSPLSSLWLCLSGLLVFIALRPHRDKASDDAPRPAPTKPAEPQRRNETIAMPSLATARPAKEPLLDPAPSTSAWRDVQLALDQENAATLAGLCVVARRALGCRSVSVFQPARDGMARLRTWDTAAEDLIPGTLAHPGKGLLGIPLKPEGPEELYESDVPHSEGCDWYTSSRTRTLGAVRFSVGGRTGLVVADDERPVAFPREGLESLTLLGTAAGVLLERGTRLARESRQKDVFANLLEMERALSELDGEDSVHDLLRRFLSDLVSDGTFLLVKRSEEQHGEGLVAWAHGRDAEGYADFPFAIPGKGILSQALARGEFLGRRLSPTEDLILLAAGEPSLSLERPGDIFVVPLRGLGEGSAALALICPDHSRIPPFLREAVELVAASAGQVLSRIAARRELENLATRDGLTGLINHRTFQANLRREILRARRTGQGLAFLLTDIDHFKAVNDTHGHPAGDAVLRHVAEVVRAQVREDLDIAARYGGEEFGCVLIGVDAERAMETAERIRTAVESSPADIGTSSSLSVTLSIGVSVFPQDAKEPQELIDRADQALYRAKNSGRNRVERALGPG